MKIEKVGISDGEFSHELPKGTKVLGVLNPLAMDIGIGLPEGEILEKQEYRFMSCKTGDIVPDTAEHLGSIGHGTTHVFFLGKK